MQVFVKFGEYIGWLYSFEATKHNLDQESVVMMQKRYKIQKLLEDM